jgi:hypothetical protein
MKTLGEMQAALQEHKLTLQQRYHVKQIGIFGSRVRQDDTPVSDVDILVELDQPVGWEIVDLHRYLENLLGVKVDLTTKDALIRKPLLWRSIQEDLVYV